MAIRKVGRMVRFVEGLEVAEEIGKARKDIPTERTASAKAEP